MQEVIAAILAEAQRHRALAKAAEAAAAGDMHCTAAIMRLEEERQAMLMEIGADFISSHLYGEEAKSTRGAPCADYGMPKERLSEHDGSGILHK